MTGTSVGATPDGVDHRARVIVLAGPSGAGKSRLAAGLGLPVVHLDDFYKDADDPSIQRHDGVIDWESAQSWQLSAAVAAIETLCRRGEVEVPIYDFGRDRRTGTKPLNLDRSRFVVAEGLFAAQILEPLRSRGLLAAAVVLANPRAVTLVRRVVRDFADRRKPPRTIIRLGISRFRTDPQIVRELTAAGATPMSNQTAEAFLAGIVRGPVRPGR